MVRSTPPWVGVLPAFLLFSLLLTGVLSSALNFGTLPASISCGDSLTIDWTADSSLSGPGLLAVYDSTDTFLATPFSSFPISDIQTPEPITWNVVTGSANKIKFVLSLASPGPEAITSDPITIGVPCIYEWRCKDDTGTDIACAPAPTPSTMMGISSGTGSIPLSWTSVPADPTTLVCVSPQTPNPKITLTPNTPRCYLGDAKAADEAECIANSPKPAQLEYELECDFKCDTKCGKFQGTCTAKLDDESWANFPSAKCNPTVLCPCAFSNLVISPTTINCNDPLTITWDVDATLVTSPAAGTLTVYDSTDTTKTTPLGKFNVDDVQTGSQSSLVWDLPISSSVTSIIIVFTQSGPVQNELTSGVLTISTPCVYEWRCKDGTGAVVACDAVPTAAQIKNISSGTGSIPATWVSAPSDPTNLVCLPTNDAKITLTPKELGCYLITGSNPTPSTNCDPNQKPTAVIYPFTCTFGCNNSKCGTFSGKCDGDLDGEKWLNLGADKCDPTVLCPCTFFDLAVSAATVSCTESLTITWDTLPTTTGGGTLTVYDSSDLSTALPVSYPIANVQAKTITITWYTPTSSASRVVIVFTQDGADKEKLTSDPISIINKCSYEMYCGLAPDLVLCGDAPTRADVISVANGGSTSLKKGWESANQDLSSISCKTTASPIVISPITPACYLEDGAGGAPALSNDPKLCTTAVTSASFDFTCVPICHPGTCGVLNSCTASLGKTTDPSPKPILWDQYPPAICDLDPLVSCACTVAKFATDLTTPVDCSQNVAFTWDWTGDAKPSGVIKVVNFANNLLEYGEIAVPDLSTGEYSTQWVIPVDEGTAMLLYIDGYDTSFTTLTSGTKCTFLYRCIDPDNITPAQIDCDMIRSKKCNECNPTLALADADYGCWFGNTLQPDKTECAALSLPLPTLDCTCTIMCTDLAKGTPVSCSDDSSWNSLFPLKCGSPDTRELSTISVVTLDNTTEACDVILADATKPAKQALCNGAETKRVQPGHLQACISVVVPQCSAKDTTDWAKCQSDTEFTTCGADIAATCPITKERDWICTVPISEGSTTINTSLKYDTDADMKASLENIFGTPLPTDGSLDADVTAMVTQCTTVKPTLTHTCSCPEELWCWVDLDNAPTTAPTVQNIVDGDVQICAQTDEQFHCPPGCKNAAIADTHSSRVIYCREPTGSFNTPSVGDKCGSSTIVSADLDRTCTANVDCTAESYCAPVDSLTAPTITSVDLKHLPNPSKSAVCTVDNFFAQSSCFTKGGTTTEPVTYTRLFCTQDTPPKDSISLRYSECLVYETSDPTQAALVDTNPGNLCDDHNNNVSFEQSGCVDRLGCSPALESIVVTTNGGTAGTDLTLDDSVDNTVAFEFDYFGPALKADQAGGASASYQVIFQWAYKTGDMTPADTKIWHDIDTVDVSTTNPNLFSWKILKHTLFDFDVFGKTQDSLEIYTRMHLINKDDLIPADYHHPVTLTVTRAKSCEGNPDLFQGLNEQCKDVNGVATLSCIVPTTGNPSTVTGPCSRTAVCDAKTPVCQNSGWWTAGVQDDCSSSCYCPADFNPADNCKTCRECPSSRGIAKPTRCGCSKCHNGFTNGPGNTLCTECKIHANVTVVKPSTALTNIFSGSPTPDEILEYDIAMTSLSNTIATLTQFPKSQIVVNKDRSSLNKASGTPTVHLVVEFNGDCTSIAKSAFKSLSAVTPTTSLEQVINTYPTVVTPTELKNDATFNQYALSTDSEITTQTAFDPPSVVSPKDDDGTNLVVIIVPIVVVLAALIIAAIFVYCFFCRDRSVSQPQSEPVEAEPKKKRGRPIDENEGAHLELL